MRRCRRSSRATACAAPGTALAQDAFEAPPISYSETAPDNPIEGLRTALESGTAGLHVPTGEVRPFPTNTSDALTSGGTYAISGAMDRMVDNLRRHCGAEPKCFMTGGAGWKMAPSLTTPFELVDNLIFDGLLQMAQAREQARLY